MKNNFGFSLVELLVVVAVILVLVGIGSYSINQFTEEREVLEARDFLSDQTKLARNLALTNQLPDGSADLNYVKLWFDGDVLMVAAYRDENPDYIIDSPYFSKKMDQDVEVTIKNNGEIVTSFGFFGKTGRLTDGEGNVSDGPIEVTVSDSGKSNKFNINSLGIVGNEN